MLTWQERPIAEDIKLDLFQLTNYLELDKESC
jgi:hypothetical protein